MNVCGILFTEIDIKDVSGCLKPEGHNDAHVCRNEEGKLIAWEDDYSCKCGCWDEDDLIDVCKVCCEVDDINITHLKN